MAGSKSSYKGYKESAALVDSFISICEDAIRCIRPCMDMYDGIYDRLDTNELCSLSKIISILNLRFEERLKKHPLYKLSDIPDKDEYFTFLGNNYKSFYMSGEDYSVEDYGFFYFQEFEGLDMGVLYAGTYLHKIPMIDFFGMSIYPDLDDVANLRMKPKDIVKKYIGDAIKADPQLLSNIDFALELIQNIYDYGELYASIGFYRSILARQFLDFQGFDTDDRFVDKAKKLYSEMSEYSICQDKVITTDYAVYWTVIGGDDEYSGAVYGEEQIYPYFYYQALELDCLLSYLDSVYHFSKGGTGNECKRIA